MQPLVDGFQVAVWWHVTQKKLYLVYRRAIRYLYYQVEV